jgi:hypothetical protein
MSRGPDDINLNVVYDWTDTMPTHSIDIVKEINEDGSHQYKAWCTNFEELEPRFAEDRVDAIEAVQRQLWAFMASGRDAAKANAEK